MEYNEEKSMEVLEREKREAEEARKKLNPFVWAGFGLDLIGFFIALFAHFWLGTGIVIFALVLSAIGVWLCVKKKGAVGTAVFYLLLDAAFLVYLLGWVMP